MVNPNSFAFQFSEKVGRLFGRGIRFVFFGGLVIVVGGLLGGRSNKSPSKNPNRPPANNTKPT